MTIVKIKNETVFVIYRNGEPYQERGRKIVYTTIGAAKRIITGDSEEIARRNFDKEKGYDESRHHLGWWDELTQEEREKRIESVKEQFSIVVYTPKGK